MRLIGIVSACALAIFWGASSGTLSGWTSAGVTNSTNTAATNSLGFTHTYQSTSCSRGPRAAGAVACAGSIAPTAAVTSGGVSATDAITNAGTYGTASLRSEFSMAPCGPVQLVNAVDSSVRPLLPRYGTGFRAADPFGGTNAITLDGTAAYASAVVAQAQPNPLVSLGATYGVGIWFRTTSTTGGPLFSIGTNPNSVAGSDSRALYITGAGRLTFVQNTSGAATTTPTTKAYNDGAWHYAYVSMSAVNVAIVGVTSYTNLYVDGDAAASGGGVLVGYSSDNGYWKLGWAPTAVTGLGSAYFNGSLSNFTVFNTAGAPAPPTTAQRASQAAFTTWASAATDRWLLGDTGTTTYGGALPASMSAPCSKIDISWSLTGPSGVVAAPGTKLSALVSAGWQVVPSPAPGATQTSTITLSRDATYDTAISGLRLYAPLSHRVQTVPVNGPWSIVFTWAGAESAFIA